LDQLTGYRTRSILSVPITTRDGRRLGVMQALNHRGGRGFDEEDTARMTAFAAQAAVAIDNATLFSEVVSARNYSESILGSMSSGVITLDRDGHVAKLNEAACTILGASAADVEGADARDFLAERNPWLLAEIETVAASGQPKTLLDVDIRTGTGGIASVNLSILRLMSEHEPVGTLILIEDISEGKRLQGAMRRFMTQKVVDQVLGRQDDLLFGTSCEASVLFADIRGFTSLAEHLAPRQTVEMLNEIFTELFEAVAASDGVLDKFIGDAIMAVYGAPLSTGRDPQNAVESAVQMLAMLEILNKGRSARELPPLRLGVGIATGDVVAGTIGSPKRMDYTVIGDSVNLAARLQDITKRYGVGIIVDEATAAAVAASQSLRELDLIQVRGRQRPEKIFQVMHENGAFQNGEAVLAAYAEGRAALLQRDWPRAIAAFERALVLNPSDSPSALMLERARILQATPPAEDWSGVWAAQT
jgi:adenylate cyclase